MSTLNAQKVKHASAVVDNITLGSDGKATLGGQLDLGTIGQIKFPATQNASSNANTLDDYEEGTWTPTLTGTGSNPTGTAQPNNFGHYTKIGNVVIFRCNIAFNGISGGSGNLRIGGLPFTPGAFYWTTVQIGYKAAASNIAPGAAMIYQYDPTIGFWYAASSDAKAPVTVDYQVGTPGGSVDFYVSGSYYAG